MTKENRIRFRKNDLQKAFLDKCILNLNCVSLRGLLQFGINTSYDNLKNYYSTRRLLPESLFLDLVYLAKVDMGELDFEVVSGSWGQRVGGELGKRKK